MLGIAALLLAVIVVALVHWTLSIDNIATRWNGLLHDRHSHYVYALKMSLALRDGDVPAFLSELSKGKTWPPLHGLLACAAITLHPGDWRVAMLPSLAGWGLMIFSGTLLAFQLATFAGKWRASAAAGTAFLLLAAGPAHRAFALDVMLESLGAGLTMLVFLFYAYAITAPDNSRWWRATALTLTLLFFEKYNYWAIALFALAIAEWSRTGISTGQIFDRLRTFDWRGQLKHPLNWLGSVLLAIVVVIAAHGPTAIELAGKRISLYPPNNLLTAAYVVFFVRIVAGLRKTRWRPATDRNRSLWYWHVLPIAISLLIPQRLGALVGFLSPTNYGDAEVHSLTGGVAFYWRVLAEDYHGGTAVPIVLAIATIPMLWHWRRLTPAHLALIAALLIGGLLVVAHPNQKSRFLHSWIPALWVLAATGTAATAVWKNRSAGAITSALLSGALLWAGMTSASAPARSRESGHRGEKNSLLNLSSQWLTNLPPGEPVCFVATQPCRGFLEWTFLQTRPRREFDWREWPKDISQSRLEQELAAWLSTAQCPNLVILDFPPATRAYYRIGNRPKLRAAIPAVLTRQSQYQITDDITDPFFGTHVLILAKPGSAHRQTR